VLLALLPSGCAGAHLFCILSSDGWNPRSVELHKLMSRPVLFANLLFDFQVRKIVYQRLNAVTCDGDTLLVTLPIPSKLSSTAQSLGLS
jgi:hypothetical protein